MMAECHAKTVRARTEHHFNEFIAFAEEQLCTPEQLLAAYYLLRATTKSSVRKICSDLLKDSDDTIPCLTLQDFVELKKKFHLSREQISDVRKKLGNYLIEGSV